MDPSDRLDIGAILIAVALLGITIALGSRTSADPIGEGSLRNSEPHGSVVRVVATSTTTRTISHSAGITVVPRHADRVCALAFADELLALGLEPVAVATDAHGDPADTLRDRLAKARPVPQAYGTNVPNFEAVASALPDLILTGARDPLVVAQLSRIAPTVVVRRPPELYDDNASLDALAQRLRDVALVVGRSDEAERFLERFEELVTTTRDRLAPTMRDRTIAFVRTRGREWRLYGERGRFGGGAMLEALGLHGPPGLPPDGTTALDPEALVGIDCDVLIVVGDPSPGAKQSLARLRRNPLWQRMTAVREGNVHEITVYRHWVLSGLLGKMQMLEDIRTAIERASS